jgi:hypothetical protein
MAAVVAPADLVHAKSVASSTTFAIPVSARFGSATIVSRGYRQGR